MCYTDWPLFVQPMTGSFTTCAEIRAPRSAKRPADCAQPPAHLHTICINESPSEHRYQSGRSGQSTNITGQQHQQHAPQYHSCKLAPHSLSHMQMRCSSRSSSTTTATTTTTTRNTYFREANGWSGHRSQLLMSPEHCK